MARLVLNTKADIFEPIEIEVNGKKHVVPTPISPQKLKEFFDYSSEKFQNDMEAPKKQIRVLLPTLTMKELDALPDYRYIREITSYLLDNLINYSKKDESGKLLPKLENLTPDSSATAK